MWWRKHQFSPTIMRCQGDAEDAEDAEDASSFTRHPKILTAPVMWIPVSPPPPRIGWLVRIDRHVPLPMRWKGTTPHNRIGSNDYYCESYHSELLALSKTIPKSSNPFQFDCPRNGRTIWIIRLDRPRVSPTSRSAPLRPRTIRSVCAQRSEFL